MVSYELVGNVALFDNALCCVGILCSMFAFYILSQAHRDFRRSKCRTTASKLGWRREAIGLVRSHIALDQIVHGTEEDLYKDYYQGLFKRIKQGEYSKELQEELLHMDQYKIEWLIQEYRHYRTINGVVKAWKESAMPNIPLSESEYDDD